MRRHKLEHLAINSTTAVAGEVRVSPALPATTVVEFMAIWSNVCFRTVLKLPYGFTGGLKTENVKSTADVCWQQNELIAKEIAQSIAF